MVRWNLQNQSSSSGIEPYRETGKISCTDYSRKQNRESVTSVWYIVYIIIYFIYIYKKRETLRIWTSKFLGTHEGH